MKSTKSDFFGYGVFFLFAGLTVLAILLGANQWQHVGQSESQALKNKIIQDSLNEYAHSLKQSTSARDRAVAAHLLTFSDSTILEGKKLPSAEAVVLLKDAIAAAPQDGDLAWMEAMDCGSLKAACNSRAAMERLMQIEPENVLAYLPTLNSAIESKNDVLRLNIMQKMSAASRSDMHFFSMAGLFVDGLKNWSAPSVYSAKELYGEGLRNNSPVSQDELKAMQAYGYSIAMAMPALQSLLQECKEGNMNAQERVFCQKIAALMFKDKSLLIKNVGVRIGMRAFDKEPEASQWRELFRQSRWQMSPENRQHSPDFDRAVLLEHGYNQDEHIRLERQLLESGVSLNPPDNWQPDDDEYLKLISKSTAVDKNP